MLGILRLFLTWRLLRLARRLIAAALVLAAVTLGAHAIGDSQRPHDHHVGSILRRLRHAFAPVSGGLEKVLVVGFKPGGGR